MSIFLFFIFFKSICLFLQNLVLRVHVRLFGPNAANRYYSTAYHYLKNGNNASQEAQTALNSTSGRLEGFSARRRRHNNHHYHHHHHHHYHPPRQNSSSDLDEEYYYQLKFNRSKDIIRQKQKLYLLQKQQVVKSGGGTTTTSPPPTATTNEDIALTTTTTTTDTETKCCCRPRQQENIERDGKCACIGEKDNKNNEQTTANSREVKILIRKRICNKSALNSPQFE